MTYPSGDEFNSLTLVQILVAVLSLAVVRQFIITTRFIQLTITSKKVSLTMSVNKTIKKQIASTVNTLKKLWSIAPKKTGALTAVAVAGSLGM